MGFENVSAYFSRGGFNACTSETECWRSNVVRKLGGDDYFGAWFSSLSTGCADPLHPTSNCTWRVVSVDAVVNRTCHTRTFFDAVAQYNQSCFGACRSVERGRSGEEEEEEKEEQQQQEEEEEQRVVGWWMHLLLAPLVLVPASCSSRNCPCVMMMIACCHPRSLAHSPPVDGPPLPPPTQQHASQLLRRVPQHMLLPNGAGPRGRSAQRQRVVGHGYPDE